MDGEKWTTDELNDIIQEYLKQNMTIEVENGHWTDPNSRTVRLLLAGEEISYCYFDVLQKEEYDG